MVDATNAARRTRTETGRPPATGADPRTGAATADESFRARLRRSARGVDAALLLAVPAVLVAVALLSAETRLGLAFSYTDPTLVSAFKSNFVHAGATHLLFNLALYALVAPTVYLLSVLAGDRDRFYVVFAAFVLAFPVVLSALNLAVPRAGASLGFSGINMAFVGYLPLALGRYLRHNFGVSADRDVASALFFVGLAAVALLSTRMAVTYAVAAVAALSAAVHLWSAGIGSPRSWDLGPAGYAELAAVGGIVLAGGLVGAFPADLAAGDGAVINVYVHFLGYALGFLAAYVTFLVAPAVERSRLVAAVREVTAGVLPGVATRSP